MKPIEELTNEEKGILLAKQIDHQTSIEEYRGKIKDSEKTRQIIEFLRIRHQAPEWATFAELNIGTGSNGGRFLDFYAVNMFPSKRNLKIAYEVKVSRADFSKELADPRKRESAEELADECYFATPAGLVRIDELPEGWGLLELNAGGLVCKKKAQQRNIKELPTSFFYSIARRSSDPRPTLPAVAWKCAGREVTDKELIELARETMPSIIEQERQQIKRQFEKELLELERFRIVVKQVTGKPFNHEGLRDWLFAQKNISPDEQGVLEQPMFKRHISSTHRSLRDLKAELEKLMKELHIETWDY